MSPYLGLFSENLDFDTVNYNTIVQPLQQQQAISQQLQRQQQRNQRAQQQQSRQEAELGLQLQQLSARSAFNPSGSQITPPTGHPTAFGNTSHFYPIGR